MNIPFVDLYKQYTSVKNEIDSAIEHIIKTSSYIGGEPVKDFERNFAEMLGVKHCIGVGNGTDAIYIVLKMSGIGKGDEVITVANSWISTSETIGQTGAKPVFIDIDPDYYTINVDLIEEKITDKTKAILPVHLFGQPAEIDKIKELCEKHDLYLIEDCAQSHFSKFKGQHTGTFGDAATFSFYPGKNLGAYGDAGCIVTNNDEYANRFRMYANHGALQKHNHKIEGVNSRLDGLQAAILNVKLKYILQWNQKRHENALIYNNLLKDIPQIAIPKIRDHASHIFHLYVIRAERRNELQEYLHENGIQTAIHYPTPLPLLEAYKHLSCSETDIPVASSYMNKILSLPMFPELAKEEIEFVSKKIKEFYK